MSHMKRSAVIDGDFRYLLHRSWTVGRGIGEGGSPWPRLCWVMLNPSTADATTDDPTVRKCIGFAKRWGYHAIDIVNLFALRATDPRSLLVGDWREHIGAENDEHISKAIRGASTVVAAWGAWGERFRERTAEVRDLVDKVVRRRSEFVPYIPPPALLTLGTTSSGEPRHPLMLSYATPTCAWLPTTARAV